MEGEVEVELVLVLMEGEVEVVWVLMAGAEAVLTLVAN